jgi:hypothetical protein
MRIHHFTSLFVGESTVPLVRRQNLALESIDRVRDEKVVVMAATAVPWERPGWVNWIPERDARDLGDDKFKAFLKDLFDHAAEGAAPDDWLLYTNSDCAVPEDFYERLAAVRGCVVEVQRLDVEGDPATLDELFTNSNELYALGMDGLAMRAGFYGEVRDLLPDFVVGEPHWDPDLSGILRSIVPVRRAPFHLYHPVHEVVWRFLNPSPAGKHNERLHLDALALGHSEKTNLYEGPDHTDTAVVLAVFGKRPEYIAAFTEAIERQLKQDLYADFYLVDLLGEDGQSGFDEALLAELIHLPIRGKEAHGNLFQKEALMNYGWRKALERGEYRYFIFPDTDVYADDVSWFRQIRQRLRENPARAVHGYGIVRDTVDAEIQFSSLGSINALNQQTGLTMNPALCWGLHRDVLLEAGGWNPFGIIGGGDSAFVAEFLNTPTAEYDTWNHQWAWYNEVHRVLPYRAVLDCVDVPIQHVYHGPASERHYLPLRLAMDAMRPVRELVDLDEDGLLYWKDAGCVEREILSQVHRLASEEAVVAVLAEYGYASRRRSPDMPALGEREVFPLEAELPPVYTVREGVGESDLAGEDPECFKVFDPVRIYRETFPFSWCERVVGQGDGHFVPLATREEVPVLKLHAEAGVEAFSATVALHPTWEPINLGQYDLLEMDVEIERTKGEGVPDILLSLVAVDGEGDQRESQRVSLKAYGLASEVKRRYEIQLEEFGDFDGYVLGRARVLRIICEGFMHLNVSRIMLW